MHFGRSGDNRFDAPDGEFGVLYAGKDERCAFIEVFGHATGMRFVEQSELAARGLARIAPRRPLRLVNLTGEGLARLGADARLDLGGVLSGRHTAGRARSMTTRGDPTASRTPRATIRPASAPPSSSASARSSR